MVVGGGQVVLEVAVSRDGRVGGVTRLRATPPFTDLLAAAVRDWTFSPATEVVNRVPRGIGPPEPPVPVDSHVLVAAVFRPPALTTPTLGEVPRDVAPPSSALPFPLTMTEPPFPPLAFAAGVTLLEARIERDGTIADVRVVQSAPPFDDAAVSALRTWRFRAASRAGTPVPAFIYVVFGFPLPISH